MVDVAAAVAAADAATVAASPALNIKLLIDTKAKRVLYTEAGKEAADFFFSILSMPVGTIAKLLRADKGKAAGVANIYDSAEKMDPSYMKSGAVRDAMLNSHRQTLLTHPTIQVPNSQAAVAGPSTFVQSTTPTSAPVISYMAPTSMTPAIGFPSGGAATGGNTGGFVQGLVIYTIMDDLTIAPMSNIPAAVLLTGINGEDKGLVLEEKCWIIRQFPCEFNYRKQHYRCTSILNHTHQTKHMHQI
jgi:hypothetical protein